MCSWVNIYFFVCFGVAHFLFRGGVLPWCPGWPQTPGLKRGSSLSLLKHVPLGPERLQLHPLAVSQGIIFMFQKYESHAVPVENSFTMIWEANS